MNGLRMAGCVACVSLVALALARDGRAADLTWNGGADGVWTNRGGGWSSGVAPGYWNSDAPDSATFGGADPLTVSIDLTGVTVADLSFLEDGYVIDGPGGLRLTDGSIRVSAGVTATVAAAMTGKGGFTKTGDGVLHLKGNNKAYSGTTRIVGGSVRIDGADSGQLGAGLAVELDGGALDAAFTQEVPVPHRIVVGSGGGTLRLVGSDKGRWVFRPDAVSGSGTLTLAFGDNVGRFTLPGSFKEFSGKWVIDSGGNGNRVADVWKAESFGKASGSDAITLRNRGTLLLRNGVVLGSDWQGVTIAGGDAKFVIADKAAVKFGGAIRGGSGDVEFFLGCDTSTAILANPGNEWTGKTALVNTGVVRLAAADVLPDASSVWLSPAVTLDLAGFSEGVGSLSGYGLVDNTAAESKATLTVGLNGTNSSFDGRVRSSGAGSTLTLVKDGPGAVQFAGDLAFSGGVAAKAGRLILQGNVSPSAPVLVLSGATLGGTGRVGRVSVRGGGVLAPGGGVGTLSAEALTLDMGAKMQFDLGATNGPCDHVVVANEFVLNGQTIDDIAISPAKGFGEGEYELVRAGSIRGSLGADRSGEIRGLDARLRVKDNVLLLDVSK